MSALGGAHWIVESEGLPNLIHEIVHAQFLGRLEDDHGFDYGSIPLDLARAEHRRTLWEELACCTVSTAYCAPLTRDPRAFARFWFADQLEIQGVFHGLEHDLPAFRARVGGALGRSEWLAERERVFAGAFDRLAESLLAVGASARVAHPAQRTAIEALWRDYSANVR